MKILPAGLVLAWLTGAAPVQADEPPPPPAAKSPRLVPAVRASGGVDLASLPAPTAGADVALVLMHGANRVELHGAAWVAQPAAVAGRPGTGGEISLISAGLRYCRSLVPRPLELAACGGLEAGALLGRGFGAAAPASVAGPWVAPSLGLLGLWNVSPSFSFALALDGLVPVVRTSFVLVRVGEVFRPPPATGRALLGIEARFR